MLLLDITGFCHDTVKVWQLLGSVITLIKIVIPLILIVLGMVDLGKAVISNEDKAINKSVTKLVQRFVAAVVVFFIPAIVSAIFNAIDLMTPTENDEYNKCIQCMTVGNCQ